MKKSLRKLEITKTKLILVKGGTTSLSLEEGFESADPTTEHVATYNDKTGHYVCDHKRDNT